jgi:hypothetical protein
MTEIRKEAKALRTFTLELVLDPQVADGLRRAAEERKTTMEALASLAIHSWLRQNKYDQSGYITNLPAANPYSVSQVSAQ